MCKLITTAELLRRVRQKRELGAWAMAGLLLLAAVSAPAKAQGVNTNTYTGMTVVHGGSIGMVPGQTVNLIVPNFYFQDGSVKLFLKHTVKVYAVTERTSGLIYSGESGGIEGHEYGHIFTLGRDNLPVPGNPTGRVQFFVEVESFAHPTGALRNVDARAPSLDLIDADGKTVLIALLLPAIQSGR